MVGSPSRAFETVNSRESTGPREARIRRISFFMLIRLGLLILFALLAALAEVSRLPGDPPRSSVGWIALGMGFGLTIIFARYLRRVRSLERFALLQTTIDVVLSAVLVQLTGGVESGFTFLFPVAVLGAAMMGTRLHTLAAAGSSLLIFTSMGVLQIAGVVTPEYPPGVEAASNLQDQLIPLLITSVAILAVGGLAVQLNSQIWRSSEAWANLRVLNQYIVNSLGSGLMTLDRDATVIFANPQARHLLGLVAHEELGGRHAKELLPGIEDELELARREEHRFEARVTRADGEVRQMGCSLGPLRDLEGGELGWVVHFQDITDLRSLEREMRRRDRLVAIGSLAATVAHEVRNPLAAMAGSAELIRSAALGPEDQRLLNIITRESQRLERIVTDLLSFSRPPPVQLSTVDIAKTAREVVEAFRTDPQASKLRLEIEAESPAAISADAGSISQVLWNLIRNAAQATEYAGHVRVSVTRSEEFAEVRVQDDGGGISEADRAKIFHPFKSGRIEGFGLGLALVHRIVRDHGGRIEVDSELGEGATFTVRLPTDRNDAGHSFVGRLPELEASGSYDPPRSSPVPPPSSPLPQAHYRSGGDRS